MSEPSTDTAPVDELAAELASADSLVGPMELFDRWERQGWTTQELAMEQDRADWAALGPFTLRELRLRLYQFFLGEAAVTSTLPALMLAAPTADAQCFLATQAADEARHTVFFARYLQAVGGVDAAPHALAERWSLTPSVSHTTFFGTDLVEATDRVRADPTNREAWIAGITIYHLLTEAVLAIAGQRAIIRTARRSERLPMLVCGALNVARDESRHIAFGVRTLREGVREGYCDAVAGMVLGQIPLLTAILVSPEQKLPRLVPRALRPLAVEISASWAAAYEALAKRLRLIGLGDLLDRTDRCWQAGISQALDDYEGLHGTAHPVAVLAAADTASIQSDAPPIWVPTAGGVYE